LSSRTRLLTRLIAAVAVCQMAAILGSIFTTPAIPTWYEGLRKPDLAPPNWVFAPVWTILYLLMGISLFFILNVGPERRHVREPVVIFGVQLVLNILWSYLFFGMQSPLLGLIGIVALWMMTGLTIVSFFKVSKLAAMLLVPYLIWVSFASYLNYALLILNP